MEKKKKFSWESGKKDETETTLYSQVTTRKERKRQRKENPENIFGFYRKTNKIKRKKRVRKTENHEGRIERGRESPTYGSSFTSLLFSSLYLSQSKAEMNS